MTGQATSLTVELKITELEKFKGLIDLLALHYADLPEEVAEYCLHHFGGVE